MIIILCIIVITKVTLTKILPSGNNSTNSKNKDRSRNTSGLASKNKLKSRLKQQI